MGYLIVSFIIFWTYLIYTYFKVGIIASISDTYFEIKWPFLFRLFIFGISIPMCLYSVSQSTGVFFAGLLIFAVGLAPGFKGDAIQSRNHVIGATGGILVSYISFATEYINWSLFYKDIYFWAIVLFLILATIIMPIGKFKKPVKNHTTWIEVVAYNIIIIALFIGELCCK